MPQPDYHESIRRKNSEEREALTFHRATFAPHTSILLLSHHRQKFTGSYSFILKSIASFSLNKKQMLRLGRTSLRYLKNAKLQGSTTNNKFNPSSTFLLGYKCKYSTTSSIKCGPNDDTPSTSTSAKLSEEELNKKQASKREGRK